MIATLNRIRIDAHACAIRTFHLADSSMERAVTEPTPDYEAPVPLDPQRQDALHVERLSRAVAPTLWPSADALAWIMERNESAVQELMLRNRPFTNDSALAAEVLDEIAQRGCPAGATDGQAWVFKRERLIDARAQLASALQDGKLAAWRWTRGSDSLTELDSNNFLQAGGAFNSPSCGLLASGRIESVLVRPDAVRDLWPARIPTSPTRAPAFKTARPPDDAAILEQADKMHAGGMTGRVLASQMRFVPGFEHVATTSVRNLIKGRYKGGRRSK